MGRALASIASIVSWASIACTTPMGDRASSERPIPPGSTIPNDEPFGLDAGRDASAPIPGDASAPFSDGGFVDAGPLPDGALLPFGAYRDPPARFAVPASGRSDGFFATKARSGPRAWATLDLDGDRFVDLVQTSDPSASATRVFADASGPFWRVYRGSRAGFSAAFTRFSVPASGLDDGFFAHEGPGLARAWVLLDLNGDARPDLVQTADPRFPEGRVFRDAAGPHWRVYLATSTGFASEARRLSVPEAGFDEGFSSVSSAVDRRQWTLLDLDGDGLRDLVQTADPSRAGAFVFSDAAGVFWKRTRMLRAADAGALATFAHYTERFVVPPAPTADGFFASAFGVAPIGPRFWTTTDITGDGVPDLVATSDPNRTGGYVWNDVFGAYWSAYQGAAGGFRLIESRVWVPSSGLGDGFYACSEEGARASRAWFSADLDGDGFVELVQTADPSRATLAAFRDVTGEYWRVSRLRPGHTPTRPLRLSLPTSGTDGGFFVANIVDSRRAWALVDLDGDGKHDLVQTSDPGAGEARVWGDDAGAYWRVWFGE